MSIESPWHTFPGPDNPTTLINVVLLQPVAGSVYVIVEAPITIPVTRPVDEPTVAIPGALLVHTPPAGVDESVTVLPVQMLVLPAIGVGVGFTVTLNELLAPEHRLFATVSVPV
jgi:hypothetical protein